MTTRSLTFPRVEDFFAKLRTRSLGSSQRRNSRSGLRTRSGSGSNESTAPPSPTSASAAATAAGASSLSAAEDDEDGGISATAAEEFVVALEAGILHTGKLSLLSDHGRLVFRLTDPAAPSASAAAVPPVLRVALESVVRVDRRATGVFDGFELATVSGSFFFAAEASVAEAAVAAIQRHRQMRQAEEVVQLQRRAITDAPSSRRLRLRSEASETAFKDAVRAEQKQALAEARTEMAPISGTISSQQSGRESLERATATAIEEAEVELARMREMFAVPRTQKQEQKESSGGSKEVVVQRSDTPSTTPVIVAKAVASDTSAVVATALSSATTVQPHLPQQRPSRISQLVLAVVFLLLGMILARVISR